MEKLVNPQKTIEVIKKHGFTFQKRYGQNFLIDPRVLERILDAADVREDDCVVEIGPGIGTLTQFLSERAGHVVAVEIDRALIPILEETLEGCGNVTVLCADILKTDLAQIAGEYNGGRPLNVVANLPYYITTPIIMGLFERKVPVRKITVMVQKEVALRMQAGPGSKDYGALSLAVGYYAKAEIAASVPPNCFIPRPAVGSAVITLTCHETPPVQVKDEAQMFALIKAAFAQRRKTLANAVGNAGELPFSKEETAQALRELGIPENIRGEALTLESFAALSDALGEISAAPGGA